MKRWQAGHRVGWSATTSEQATWTSHSGTGPVCLRRLNVSAFRLCGSEKTGGLAQHEPCWMEARWLRQRPAPFSKEERRFTRHCSTHRAFTVWWRSGRTVKNLSRSRKVCVCGQNIKAKKHRAECGTVRGHVQMPLHGMRQKHQEDEDARDV